MPTNGFSFKPLKVKLLAGEQMSQPRFVPPDGFASGPVSRVSRPRRWEVLPSLCSEECKPQRAKRPLASVAFDFLVDPPTTTYIYIYNIYILYIYIYYTPKARLAFFGYGFAECSQPALERLQQTSLKRRSGCAFEAFSPEPGTSPPRHCSCGRFKTTSTGFFMAGSQVLIRILVHRRVSALGIGLGTAEVDVSKDRKTWWLVGFDGTPLFGDFKGTQRKTVILGLNKTHAFEA